jgi:hypothetical protein
MATLPIHARPISQARSLLPSFARVVSFLEAVLDVLGEAERLASTARTRYPSAD